ncbi:MAG: succinate dehydrogenase, cytochrome b556 subunit [Novosphingobium sp.]|nr:succinate dehydrogenase, cytochrome b556 subunit [Novosphingobium sp.]
MATATNRPLSPHLQIWKWGPAMAVSILHRATGTVNAIAGLGVLLWWLGALVSGPEAYATFAACAKTWYGQIVLFGITASVFIHAASGVRHFVLDIGAGFELETNKMWSILSPVIGIALAVAFWAVLLLA